MKIFQGVLLFLALTLAALTDSKLPFRPYSYWGITLALISGCIYIYMCETKTLMPFVIGAFAACLYFTELWINALDLTAGYAALFCLGLALTLRTAEYFRSK